MAAGSQPAAAPEAAPSEAMMKRVPLNNSWSIWAAAGNLERKRASVVVTFIELPPFWAFVEFLNARFDEMLDVSLSLYLFKQGISPHASDSQNKAVVSFRVLDFCKNASQDPADCLTSLVTMTVSASSDLEMHLNGLDIIFDGDDKLLCCFWLMREVTDTTFIEELISEIAQSVVTEPEMLADCLRIQSAIDFAGAEQRLDAPASDAQLSAASSDTSEMLRLLQSSMAACESSASSSECVTPPDPRRSILSPGRRRHTAIVLLGLKEELIQKRRRLTSAKRQARHTTATAARHHTTETAARFASALRRRSQKPSALNCPAIEASGAASGGSVGDSAASADPRSLISEGGPRPSGPRPSLTSAQAATCCAVRAADFSAGHGGLHAAWSDDEDVAGDSKPGCDEDVPSPSLAQRMLPTVDALRRHTQYTRAQCVSERSSACACLGGRRQSCSMQSIQSSAFCTPVDTTTASRPPSDGGSSGFRAASCVSLDNIFDSLSDYSSGGHSPPPSHLGSPRHSFDATLAEPASDAARPSLRAVAMPLAPDAVSVEEALPDEACASTPLDRGALFVASSPPETAPASLQQCHGERSVQCLQSSTRTAAAACGGGEQWLASTPSVAAAPTAAPFKLDDWLSGLSIDSSLHASSRIQVDDAAARALHPEELGAPGAARTESPVCEAVPALDLSAAAEEWQLSSGAARASADESASALVHGASAPGVSAPGVSSAPPPPPDVPLFLTPSLPTLPTCNVASDPASSFAPTQWTLQQSSRPETLSTPDYPAPAPSAQRHAVAVQHPAQDRTQLPTWRGPPGSCSAATSQQPPIAPMHGALWSTPAGAVAPVNRQPSLTRAPPTPGVHQPPSPSAPFETQDYASPGLTPQLALLQPGQQQVQDMQMQQQMQQMLQLLRVQQHPYPQPQPQTQHWQVPTGQQDPSTSQSDAATWLRQLQAQLQALPLSTAQQPVQHQQVLFGQPQPPQQEPSQTLWPSQLSAAPSQPQRLPAAVAPATWPAQGQQDALPSSSCAPEHPGSSKTLHLPHGLPPSQAFAFPQPQSSPSLPTQPPAPFPQQAGKTGGFPPCFAHAGDRVSVQLPSGPAFGEMGGSPFPPSCHYPATASPSCGFGGSTFAVGASQPPPPPWPQPPPPPPNPPIQLGLPPLSVPARGVSFDAASSAARSTAEPVADSQRDPAQLVSTRPEATQYPGRDSFRAAGGCAYGHGAALPPLPEGAARGSAGRIDASAGYGIPDRGAARACFPADCGDSQAAAVQVGRHLQRPAMDPPGAEGRQQAVHELAVRMGVFPNAPERAACNREVKRLQSQQAWRESHLLMQLMGRAGLPAEVGRYNTLILWFKKNKQWTEAMAILSEMKSAGVQPSIVSYNSVIDACGKARQLKLAFEMLDHIANDGLAPDTVSYTSLIDACGKAQQLERAVELLAQMKAAGVRPNSFTYNALIDACAKAGEVERAFDVLRQMQSEGIRANTRTFTALIDACGKSQLIERAFMVLRQMQQEGVKPNTATYTCLVDACGKSQQLDRAFDVLRMMKEAKVPANTHTYNALIDACGKARQLDRAFAVSQEMQRAGVRPDAVSFTCLVDACGRSMQIDRAMEVVQQMQQVGLRPNTAAFTSLIDACGKSLDLERAFQVMQYMTQIAVPPNTATFTSLIDACGRAQQLEQAFLVFERMRHLGVAPNTATFTTLINACAKCANLDRAMSVLRTMYASNVKPDTITYTALINACGRTKQLDRAFELLMQMRQHSLQPNVVTYNAVIDVCCRCGDLRRACSTLHQMRSAGVQPDVVTFNMLLHVCCKHHEEEQLFSLLSQMRDMRIAPNSVTMHTLSTVFSGNSARLEQALASLRDA